MSDRYPELAELLGLAEGGLAEAKAGAGAPDTVAELLDPDECARLRDAGDSAELARRYLEAVRLTQGDGG